MTATSSRSHRLATASTVALTAGLAVVLAGCSVAGPTSGTDKRVGEQLVEDLASITSLSKKSAPIDYRPRPGLVPAPESGALPVPQESVTESAAAFSQSPEQLREELLASESRRGIDTRSVSLQSKRVDPATGKRIDMRARAAAITQDGSRAKLSDPPVAYRQAATTAPTGDLGVPEYKKERARKAALGKEEDKGFLRKLLPF